MYLLRGGFRVQHSAALLPRAATRGRLKGCQKTQTSNNQAKHEHTRYFSLSLSHSLPRSPSSSPSLTLILSLFHITFTLTLTLTKHIHARARAHSHSHTFTHTHTHTHADTTVHASMLNHMYPCRPCRCSCKSTKIVCSHNQYRSWSLLESVLYSALSTAATFPGSFTLWWPALTEQAYETLRETQRWVWV